MHARTGEPVDLFLATIRRADNVHSRCGTARPLTVALEYRAGDWYSFSVRSISKWCPSFRAVTLGLISDDRTRR